MTYLLHVAEASQHIFWIPHKQQDAKESVKVSSENKYFPTNYAIHSVE
jgi:hypothetical protein